MITSSNDGRRRGREQVTRLESFYRTHRNRHDRRKVVRMLLLLSLYAVVVLIYGRTLSPRWGPFGEDGALDPPSAAVAVEPRSLADVALINAEGVWRAHKEEEELLRRRAEVRNELEEKQRRYEESLERARRASAAGAGEEEGEKDKKGENPLQEEEPMEKYNESLSKLRTQRTPRALSAGKDGSSDGGPSQHQNVGYFPVILMIGLCTIFRLGLSAVISHYAENPEHESGDAQITRPSLLFNHGAMRRASVLRRRARADHARRQFENFVARLNEQRRQNGEREISGETLRLVASNRDFDGNDYDDLLRFRDEAGPAVGTFLSSIGMTRAEIERLPARTIGLGDDLLRVVRQPGGSGGVGSSGSNGTDGAETVSGEGAKGEPQTCSVCLETYQVGEIIRTVPCFHSFHAACIDPWLMDKSECPICKHSAMG